MRRWLVSGEGTVGWYRELADNKHGDLVSELDISGATALPCPNPVLAEQVIMRA